MPGLLVRGVGDRVLEPPVGRRHDRGRVGGDVGQLEDGLRVARRDRRDRPHPRHAVGRTDGAVPGEVGARDDERRRAVGRGADVEQSQRIGHDRAGEDVLDRVLLAEPRVRVLQPVLRVLHLHLREVVGRRAVQVDAPARVQREVHRVRRPQEVEALPVGIVRRSPPTGAKKPFGVVSAPITRATSQKPARICARACGAPASRGARGVARADRHAGPAELLGERRLRR